MVHLLQLLLGGLQGVRGRVEFVGFEALIAEVNSEGLILSLRLNENQYVIMCAAALLFCLMPLDGGISADAIDGWERAHFLTSGTEWLKDADAASVVTERAA